MFTHEFQDYLSQLTLSNNQIIIAGDINISWNDINCSDTAKLKDTLDMLNLTQLVSQPTYILGNTLDWVITRKTSCIHELNVSTLLSDHFAVHCSVLTKKPPITKSVITYRKYKLIDQESLNADVLNSPLFPEPPNSDVDDLVKHYNTVMGELMDKHAPEITKRVAIRPKNVPWITEKIKLAQTERRKMERKWRSTRLIVHRELFTDQRDYVTTLCREAKQWYYLEKIGDCGSDPKKLYKVMNELLHRRRDIVLPSYDSNKDMANQFSSFFLNKIEKIRADLDAIQVLSPLNNSNDNNTLLPESFLDFASVSDEIVSKIIRNSPVKSCSLDPLPTHVLKHTKHLVTFITNIVNKSIITGTFPSSFKRALVSPLIKKSTLDAQILRNYRPVSNLPFISKILEKVIAKQLTDHMKVHALYEKHQSAYRCYHSTETALVKVQNDLLKAIDDGSGVFLVLLDLSAAFDTIDHDILLNRLKSSIGLSDKSLSWFNSYLKDRFQSIVIVGVTSEPVNLKYGVPQGSVLGPVLFTIYTSPIGEIARKYNVEIHIYADDTQLYIYFKMKVPSSQLETLMILQSCVSEIKSWMAYNKLKFNDDKSEFLVVCAPWSRNEIRVKTLTVGTSLVEATVSARNLGVHIDHTLKMDVHIQKQCQSMMAQLEKHCWYSALFRKTSCRETYPRICWFKIGLL